jgi:hypothetical protein
MSSRTALLPGVDKRCLAHYGPKVRAVHLELPRERAATGAATKNEAPLLSTSNECAPHPNTFSDVPSVFVSAQFCATESTEKEFLCTENTFSVLSVAQKGPQKGPQKHIRKNTISRHIHSTCLATVRSAVHLRLVARQRVTSWAQPIDSADVNAYGKNLSALIKTSLLTLPSHAVFLDSCFRHHCGQWDKIKIDGGVVHSQCVLGLVPKLRAARSL